MKNSNTLFKENIPAFSVQGKLRSISVLQKNLQSSKTFQKLCNMFSGMKIQIRVICTIICTKMLQIQRKICFKVNFCIEVEKKEM
jgi:hypothetical protein